MLLFPLLSYCFIIAMLELRSIKNKLILLHNLLYGNHYQVLLFTESWLQNGFTNGLLDPRNLYNIFRSDRIDGYGGVIIFVSRSLKSYLKCVYSADPCSLNEDNSTRMAYCECLVCCIEYYNISFVVCCFYCPPDITFDNFRDLFA